MPPIVQLKILTRRRGAASHAIRFIEGEVGSSTRQRADDGGAPLPVGGTSFIVPRGSVQTDEIVSFLGQNFRVTGVNPIRPWFVRDVLTTDQLLGTLEEVVIPLPHHAIDDRIYSMDGQTVGAR